MFLFLSTFLLFGLVSAAGLNAGLNAQGQANLNDKSVNIQIQDQENTSINDGNGNAYGNGNGATILVNGEEVQFKSGSRLKFGDNKTILLPNGKQVNIQISPEQARLRVRERINVSCDGQCNLTLREREHNGEMRAAYEIKAEKEAKFLGIFKTKMDVSVDIDAETGEIVSTNRPWWAFLATETKVNVSDDE